MDDDLTTQDIDELEALAASTARTTRRCLPLAMALREEHAGAAQAARESTARLRRPTVEELRDGGR